MDAPDSFDGGEPQAALLLRRPVTEIVSKNRCRALSRLLIDRGIGRGGVRACRLPSELFRFLVLVRRNEL